MIGNLGRAAYSPITDNDGNNGNDGNITSKPAPILNQKKENQFPLHGNEPGTMGTEGDTSTTVPIVPECLNVTGNNSSNKNSIEKQLVMKSVPVVPAVPAQDTGITDKPAPLAIPKGHGIWRLADIVGERDEITTEREVCYCCKGTDFWIAGPADAPYKLCRKCRPPIPGRERIPDKT
jgi:hypothetical protein